MIEQDRVLSLLRQRELVLEERVPWSSNATFLCRLREPGADDIPPDVRETATDESSDAEPPAVDHSGDSTVSQVADEASTDTNEPELLAVYKPRQGERPLWDFPDGTLYKRELAAYRVSEALGWGLVPPTILREGPFGVGMVQAFIPHDPNAHYLELSAPDAATIQRLSVFDALVNNADRKSGHVLQDETGALWAIDHGLTFHVEPKLRTVIWEYAGQSMPVPILNELRAFRSSLGNEAGQADGLHGGSEASKVADSDTSPLSESLAALLSLSERIALQERLNGLIEGARFPDADPDRRMVPWPPV